MIVHQLYTLSTYISTTSTPTWNFVPHPHDIFPLYKLLLPLANSISYPSSLYLLYVITLSSCLDKVIRTRRRQSLHQDRFQITAPAVLSAALLTRMKIGHRSLILQSADVFRTVLLSVTIVSYLPDLYPILASIRYSRASRDRLAN
jgi:hypothetical protein